MKKLTTIHDAQLNVPYDLYQVPAETFVRLMRKSYEHQGIDMLKAQEFNTEPKIKEHGKTYVEALTRLKGIQSGLLPQYAHYNYEETMEQVSTFEAFFNQDTTITNRLDRVSHLGYELMPFAVSVSERNFTLDATKIELLDGFRRIFYTKELPKGDVLVKVYDQLDDKTWITSMLTFNSWKYADSGKSLRFLDRGLRLGLFYRYGLHFIDFPSYQMDSIEHTLNNYFGGAPYYTLYENDLFAEDIRMLQKIKLHRPIFEFEKKNKTERIDLHDTPYKYPAFLNLTHTLITQRLGLLRREETVRILNGESVQRKSLPFENYLAFIQDESLQELFIKLCNMQVTGHIENSIKKNLKDQIFMIVEKDRALQSTELKKT